MSALLLALLLAAPGRADAQADYRAGVDALRTGDHAAALVSLRAALEAGAVDPHVYHGLGNALYRQGSRGPAIAAWRRGLWLAPGNGDIAANLDFARKQGKDRIDPPALATGPFFWQAALSTATSARMAGASLALGLLLLVLRRLRPRPALLPAAAACLVAAALLAAGTAVALRARAGAVVVQPSLAVQSALGPAGLTLFTLHEGAEVGVGEAARAGGVDYLQVLLPDGRKGWVPAAALLSADPSAPFQWL
jgi:tetratricopeptide (TPR) repeat protein